MREEKSREERGEQRERFCLPSVTVRDMCPKETSVCFLKSLFFLELELERMQGNRGAEVGQWGTMERDKGRKKK